MILAGDIGGTKSILGLFRADPAGDRPVVVYKAMYKSGEQGSLGDLVRLFLDEATKAQDGVDGGYIETACLGIAGPVVEQRTDTTNLPWTVDGAALMRELGLGHLRLINDLEATGYGIRMLDEDRILTLSPGDPDPGAPAVLVAAGTGLGEAILVPGPSGLQPIPGEGGHADFAPRNELEIGLLRYLMMELPRVSVERVVSGPGLFRIYRYLRDAADPGPEPEWLTRRLGSEDPGMVVSESALSGECRRCAAALDLFVSLYGAEAGNLALKVMALGGVYIGGGIAPKILPKLRDGTFLAALRAKGRMSDLMERMPVRVILEPETALLGAAVRAACDLNG